MNQVVAYNLQRARRHRGLTQDQAAELLEPYLGVRWSRASFSAAERSAEDGRVRQFDANELLAFASAFELPVNWFLMPPPDASEIRAARIDGAFLTPAMLVDLLLVTGLSELSEALREYLERIPAPQRTERQRELATGARIASDTFMRKELGDLGELQEIHRALAKRYGAAAARANELMGDVTRRNEHGVRVGPERDQWESLPMPEPADETITASSDTGSVQMSSGSDETAGPDAVSKDVETAQMFRRNEVK